MNKYRITEQKTSNLNNIKINFEYKSKMLKLKRYC